MAAGFGVPALAGQSVPAVAWSSLTRPEPRTLCRLKAGLQTFHRSLACAKHVLSRCDNSAACNGGTARTDCSVYGSLCAAGRGATRRRRDEFYHLNRYIIVTLWNRSGAVCAACEISIAFVISAGTLILTNDSRRKKLKSEPESRTV